jgi:peptidoglycan/LPS O-acetylase OafA/YrhL
MGAVGRRPHVDAMDLVRAVTIVSVIAVHSTWFTANGGGSPAAGGALMLLHFTRESFMALTGFVIAYSYLGRPVAWGAFYARRYRLILFPYLVWSAAYLALAHPLWPPLPFLARYARAVATGTAWFHLYYLLITMQFYLLVPAFLPVVRRMAGQPGWLAGALVAEVALMAYDQYGIHGPVHNLLLAYRGTEVWTYALYFLLGGVLAAGWDRWQAVLWRQRHRWALLLLTTAAGAEAVYILQWRLTGNINFADAVLQPAMVPFAVSLFVFLVNLGQAYGRWRQRCGGHPLARTVRLISEVSFGMYLCHPMLMAAWLWLWGRSHARLPHLPTDLLTVAVITVASALAALGLSRLPGAVWLVGRSAPAAKPLPAVRRQEPATGFSPSASRQ